ncbi:tetratricopeptide repeat protein [Marinobacter sp. VGCF2001]|uniref:tetratricopeptide repeat protein n=1 Tax=Marinobacter sp. VGCF2001 TaxID=3417189 RepID=UPI003CFA8B39
MILVFSPKIPVGLLALVLILAPIPAAAQESFRVELGRDGETLGDMRPVFLKFESRPLPAISPREVARRYQKLFESSDEPEVRVDALNRLNNIRDRSGENVGFSQEQETAIYQEVLGSYENILAKGSFSGRLDELLYQMAKAHALTGQPEQSIARLKQLVGLYPRSELVPEARFRIAEAAFSANRYAEAETGYRQLLDDSSRPELADKARYMLGWSQFKQGQAAWNRAAQTFMTVLDRQLPDSASLNSPPASAMDMLEDTFRVLALMASRKNNAQTLSTWLADRESSPWVHLLYDRLADLHSVERRYEQAVAVNDVYISEYPGHPASPDFLAQSVTYWQLAGDPAQALAARERYVQRLGDDARFRVLAIQQQALWSQYARFLAEHHYAMGSELAGRNETLAARASWARAAGYYEQLAPRSPQTGEFLHLAGDARLLAGNRPEAVQNFRSAAYDHVHQGSDDSAWAAIRIARQNLEATPAASRAELLGALSQAEQRYGKSFGPDARLSGLRADLANRWYETGEYDRALEYARSTLEWGQAKPSEQYAAWLVTARIRQNNGEYGLAERGWRQAIRLAEVVSQESRAEKHTLLEQLATAIYKQGEEAALKSDTTLAVAHFQRVEGVLPGSEIAVRARYDAANTLLRASDWLSAINELNRFRSDYPKHDLTPDISEKLVLAYQESGQGPKAAEELLDRAETLAAPWPERLRAASIYHDEGDDASRNALYKRWLAVASQPASAQEHLQHQTMRWRLITSGESVDAMRNQLLIQESDSQWHSEETLRWAADSALYFGVRAVDRFTGIALVHPLERSLAKKQAAMKQAQDYLQQAESFAGERVRSEVLYRRAELYRTLASDLMASEMPAELNDMETMQYQMLLEEQAFPLEEEAMALHARNHARITDVGFDDWIQRSLDALATMHPGRYDRQLRWMSWSTDVSQGGS